MSTFVEAVQNTTRDTVTSNGMITLSDSGDALTTLFFQIGSSRGKDLTPQFERAFQANPTAALRIMFWARDVRGGAGERETFRKLLKYFVEKNRITPKSIVELVPEYGRWDDLFVLFGTNAQELVLNTIAWELGKANGLLAKWLPRKGSIAKLIRKHMNLNEQAYRKLIVGLSNTVEQKMCARQWSDINYNHVPSVAAARYQKAFTKHDTVRYEDYKKGFATGESKIHAGAVYPYDVVKSTRMGDKAVAAAQWEALPNYLGDNRIVPMVDTSGSMSCPVGGNKNLTCMDISVALGLYIADKQQGSFKDLFLTFNRNSRLELLRGDFLSKLKQLEHAEWGGNTDLGSAYDEILRVAVTNKLTQEEMPEYLVVLTDLEFDTAVIGNRSVSAFELANNAFKNAGYKCPKIIWWNLNARPGSLTSNGNVPVTFREDGTALVSGFSPSIMKAILSADKFTPIDIMLETINSERYVPIIA